MKKQWISLCLAALLALPLAACASKEAQPSPAPGIAPESSAAPENSAGLGEESTPEPAQTPVPMDALDTGYQPRSFTEEEADTMRQYLNDHELLDYERPLLAGGTAKLSDYEGKVTVINLMATWCGWCVKELPDFAEAAALYGDAVNFLAVNTFENAGAEGGAQDHAGGGGHYLRRDARRRQSAWRVSLALSIPACHHDCG